MLELMYITNDINIAEIADRNGVDRIFIDLEINGKDERQGHLDTVISRHSIDDVAKIKNVLSKANLLVRVNPIFEGSQKEIDRVICDGADVVMLPYFKTAEEVRSFVNIVNGRVRTCLLCETPEAVECMDDILNIDGIDEIHIGLNDLHLGYKMNFMFELLCNGTVEFLCNKFRSKGISYGFGGVASLNAGMLPAKYIIGEHYRLGSSRAILSRSFYNSSKAHSDDDANLQFAQGVAEIREYEKFLEEQNEDFFAANSKEVENLVVKIVRSMEK